MLLLTDEEEPLEVVLVLAVLANRTRYKSCSESSGISSACSCIPQVGHGIRGLGVV